MRLFAKLEGQNPTGSVKDRIVAFMLKRARDEGRLKPGQEIVEASTGNTGIALAMVGRRMGHPVRVVVPHTVFSDLSQALKAWEAQIEWVPADLGIKSAIDAAQDIAARDGAFLLNQFASPDNPLCHYETTAVEILRQLPDVDAFVCGLGTGGTAMGVGRRLREHNPALKLIAAEPHPGSNLQGIAAWRTASYRRFSTRRGSIRRCSCAASAPSAPPASCCGARACWPACRQARCCTRLSSGRNASNGGNIVMLFADSGWKYLNSPAFQLDIPLEDEHEAMDDILWW